MDSRRLRPFRSDDFEAFHAIVSDYEIVKMLVIWPYPAEPDFTRTRMNTPEARAGQVLVIEESGAFAGCVGIMTGGLGYMLGQGFSGRGLATWAVGEILDRLFGESGFAEVTACVWHDNPASERVLLKNGFRRVGDCEDYCEARGERLKNNRFSLGHADWLARRA